MTDAISTLMPLSAWRCDATMHASFYDPLVADELMDADITLLIHFIAPSHGPAVGENKDVLPFFVPCSLKVATLTPKMQAKTGQTEGRQRSSAHVTVAMFLVIDVDGLLQAKFDALLDKLRAAGLTFISYNTHSHGRTDKPDVRARLVLIVDRPLNADEYKLAWLGFDLLFCDGAIAAADDSGKAMWQQQGVHAVHPDRIGKAFRIVHKAGVASADFLIAAGARVCKPKVDRPQYVARQLPSSVQIDRLTKALPWIDAETTSTWITAITALKALAQVLGFDVAKQLAVTYSEQAGDAAKAKNSDKRYDPETFFDNVMPTMPPDAAMATLCVQARDGAVKAVNADLGKPEWSERGHAAAVYLCQHHNKLFSEITEAT